MIDLTCKIALVTGSTTGIGEAIARRLARAGASVMIHGLIKEDAEQAAAEIKAAGGGDADCILADLAQPSECEKLIAATAARFGGLHILVNNAAVMTRSDLETTDAETFDRTIAVNLRAPLLLFRAALPYLRLGGGAVLNIGSVNGYCGEYNQLAYAISKGGLMTLSRNLADAHGPEKIRVNHFNVGWVLTKNEYALKMKEGLPDDWPERLPPNIAPSGRLLSPEEVAEFALLFVSGEGALVSGAVVDLEQYPMIGRNPRKLLA
ncbi:MAG: SDR family NAD(P)-dependent oxidoreductase [Janthinobacterium lividum]